VVACSGILEKTFSHLTVDLVKGFLTIELWEDDTGYRGRKARADYHSRRGGGCGRQYLDGVKGVE
jgi:hypothetical protein